MADTDRSLQRLIEEGSDAARQPPLEHLRRRVGRRRTRRKLAGAALAAAILAIPAARYADSGALSGPNVAGAAAPTATAQTSARTPPPPLTPQQKAELAQQAGTLTVAPTSVVAGNAVTVSGHGCAPGSTVALGFGPSADASPAVTVHAGANGWFASTMTVSPIAGTGTGTGTGTGVRRIWAQCAAPAASSPATRYGAVYVFAS